jgi:hypothetical protein
MNSPFGNLNTDGMEEAQDRLGGFQVLESDIYTGPIKVMYAGKAASGAQFVTVIVDFQGREYHETVYVTNKKGENWFLNKDDKIKKVGLPGFTTINDICLVTTGSPLSEQVVEDKMVKVWDTDLKKEMPKSVPVLVMLLGQTISLAISKNFENKSEKDGNGGYRDTAETRHTNTIEKVFHTESKGTVAEATNNQEPGAFWKAWSDRNKGKDRDKRTIKEGIAGKPGASGKVNAGPPQAAGATAAPRKSLFGQKSV